MTAASLILATLSDSGPAHLPELRSALAVAHIRREYEVEHALHDLMQAGRVAVECGVYRAI